MDIFLEERIRAAFPSGTNMLRDNTQIDIGDYKERLKAFLKEVTQTLPLRYDIFASNESLHCYEITFTSSKLPDDDVWWRTAYHDKLKLLEDTKLSDVAYTVSISRIADYYIRHFNHRVPRPDTTYLDFINKSLDWTWSYYEAVIIESLYKNSFHPASPEMLNEKVPFVTVWGGSVIPDDDPRWDDYDFEPDPVIGTVYECLFHDY